MSSSTTAIDKRAPTYKKTQRRTHPQPPPPPPKQTNKQKLTDGGGGPDGRRVDRGRREPVHDTRGLPADLARGLLDDCVRAAVRRPVRPGDRATAHAAAEPAGLPAAHRPGRDPGDADRALGRRCLPRFWDQGKGNTRRGKVRAEVRFRRAVRGWPARHQDSAEQQGSGSGYNSSGAHPGDISRSVRRYTCMYTGLRGLKTPKPRSNRTCMRNQAESSSALQKARALILLTERSRASSRFGHDGRGRGP